MDAAKQPPLQSGDIETAIQSLVRQIERGRQLLRQERPDAEQFDRWNRDTEEVLGRIYGRHSPNVTSVVRTVGNTPVWLGMPAETRHRYRRSALDNQVRKLEGCASALRRKAARAEYRSSG